MTSPSDLSAVVQTLRDHEAFAITTHENPDGDALGSLLGLHLGLLAAGHDSVMVIGEQALPREYRFLELPRAGASSDLPADLARRVVVAVDCAQESRIAAKGLIGHTGLTVNIDHHHDNTRFGAVNLVVADASSTGEILVDVLTELGVDLAPPIATALYTALVTDTGRFQYANTTPKALRIAATLVEAGADPQRVFRSVYESIELARLRLLASAVRNTTVHDDGKVLLGHLARTDFAEAGADDMDSEGIIDHLRGVEGVVMAGLIRELPPASSARCKVSLRTTNSALDVSAIARQSGGGGHPQAAGFSSDLEIDGVRGFVLDAYAAARR